MYTYSLGYVLNTHIYYVLLHYFGRRDPRGGEGVVGG